MIDEKTLAEWKELSNEYAVSVVAVPPKVIKIMLAFPEAIAEIERLQVLCREAADLFDDGQSSIDADIAMIRRLRSAAPMAATTTNPIYQLEVKNGE